MLQFFGFSVCNFITTSSWAIFSFVPGDTKTLGGPEYKSSKDDDKNDGDDRDVHYNITGYILNIVDIYYAYRFFYYFIIIINIDDNGHGIRSKHKRSTQNIAIMKVVMVEQDENSTDL